MDILHEDRIVTGKKQHQDFAVVGGDKTLRPQRLEDYVGQDQLLEQLGIFITAARRRKDALDHVLLFGPPGLGKTTLAGIIANEMNAGFRQTSGPILDKPGDLAAILTSLQAGDILFIDEIHRMNTSIEEILYPAMEDYQIDIIVGEGPAARALKIDLEPFTLVGATTRAGMLSAPLRDRFGIIERLEYYSVVDLARIVIRSAAILKVRVNEDGAREIAQRARGTPRIVNRLLRRLRDFSEVKGEGIVTQDIARKGLDLLNIDIHGCDAIDRRFMRVVIEVFDGGPVGVESIAASMGDDSGTLEDLVEPYLIQQQWLVRTPRGRKVTDKGLAIFSA